MKNKRRIRIIVLVIVLVVIASFGAWQYMHPSLAASNTFVASGTIESISIRLSPEVSGVITELDAAEGQDVKAGQVLAKINDATAQTQYAQTKAALQSAQENLALAEANFALVSANNTSEQHQSALSAAELEVVNARQALQVLYDNAPVTTANLEHEIADAAKALDKAKDHVASINGASDPEDIQRAQSNVVITKDALKKAKEDYDRMLKYYKYTNNKNVGRAYLQIKVSNAQDAYDHAVTVLSNLLGHANELDLAVAEADAKVAEAQLADAQRRFDDLVDGVDPKALEVAQARLDAAQAKLAAIQADPSAKQLAVAQDQVDVAQAQVANVEEQIKALEIQLGKYTISAPSDGVVLSRGVEVGETTAPGTVLYEIGPLQQLQLTVYLPEEKFGTVKPGDTATVKVDAYPDRTFTARVDRLSDKAEFTPRNVQTVEGRRDTVFAIYMSLDNSDLALMPGMWADVTFASQ